MNSLWQLPNENVQRATGMYDNIARMKHDISLIKMCLLLESLGTQATQNH